MSFLDDFFSGLQQKIAPTNAPGAQSTETKAADTLAEIAYQYTLGQGKALVSRFRESGTGQKLIAETKAQEIDAAVNNPKNWLIVGGVVLVILFIGYGIGKR